MRAQSETNYNNNNNNKFFKNMIDELASNTNYVIKLKYQSSNFKKTDYRDEKDIINAIYKTQFEIFNKNSNNIIYIINFDLLRFNQQIELELYNFLTRIIKQNFTSMHNISVRTKKIFNILQTIDNVFKLKARLWQVNILFDIIKSKVNICANAKINANKTLVYVSILILIEGYLLVSLSNIAPVKNQIRHKIQSLNLVMENQYSLIY